MSIGNVYMWTITKAKKILQLLVQPNKKRLVLMIFLLAWISGWATFLSQTLSTVSQALEEQTRENVWGDLVIDSSQALSDEEVARIDDVLRSDMSAKTHMIELLTTVVLDQEEPTLIAVQGIDQYFPLYGTFTVHREEEERVPSFTEDGVWVSEGLAVWEEITLWTLTLPVVGRIAQLPGNTINVFNRGRTLLVARTHLEESGLLERGSRVSYTYAYRLRNGLSPAQLRQLRNQISEMLPTVQVQTAEDARQTLQRFFEQLRYIVVLALISLVILTYAWLMVVNDMLMRSVRQTIDLIRLLWVTTRRIGGALWMIWGGSILIALLGWWGGGYIAWSVIPWDMFGITPTRVWTSYLGVTWITVLLVAALSVRRQEVLKPIYQNAITKWLWRWLLLLVLWWALVIEVWASWATVLLAGLIVAIIALFYAISRGVLWAGYRYASTSIQQRSMTWWLWAMRRALQPKSAMQLMVTIMSTLLSVIGITLMFQFAIQWFLQQLIEENQPNTFILNISETHLQPVRETLDNPPVYDVILWRIISINNQPLGAYLQERNIYGSRFTREFNMTTVDLTDDIVAGETILREGGISVDNEIATDMWLALWDMIRVSIVWREIDLRVTQLRRTERDGIQPFFFFQLPAEGMWALPRTYFALVYLTPWEERNQAIRELVDVVWPGLSFIEIDEIIQQVEEIAYAIAWAMRLVLLSIFGAWWVIFMFCLWHLLHQHRDDIPLLYMLGWKHVFLRSSTVMTWAYPLLVSWLIATMMVAGAAYVLWWFQPWIPIYVLYFWQASWVVWAILLVFALILSRVWSYKI